MDMSKFTLDRNAYLGAAAAAAANSIYDVASSGKGTTGPNPYTAYLDPTSVLTKAYFEHSKMYQDRAANYAFDISKIYGAQQQHQQQLQQAEDLVGGSLLARVASSDDRGSTPQSNLSTDNGGGGSSSNGGGRISGSDSLNKTPSIIDTNQLESMGGGYGSGASSTGSIASAASSTSSSSAAAAAAAATAAAAAAYQYQTQTSTGDFRRPLTVIF